MRTTNHKNRNKTETGKIGNHKKSNLLRLPIVLNFANAIALSYDVPLKTAHRYHTGFIQGLTFQPF